MRSSLSVRNPPSGNGCGSTTTGGFLLGLCLLGAVQTAGVDKACEPRGTGRPRKSQRPAAPS